MEKTFKSPRRVLTVPVQDRIQSRGSRIRPARPLKETKLDIASANRKRRTGSSQYLDFSPLSGKGYRAGDVLGPPEPGSGLRTFENMV